MIRTTVRRNLVLAACCLLATSAVAQDQTDQAAQNSSRFELTLDNSLVSGLESLGMLQSPVPEHAQGRIAVIQIQFADSVTRGPVNVNAPVSLSGAACLVSLNDKLIDQARNQPIRISVPRGSTFAQVFLQYPSVATATTSPSDPAPSSTAPSHSPISHSNNVPPVHFVQLAENQTMAGQLDIANKLKFSTRFGDVDISIGHIAGIRFHIDGEDSAIIVLKNGDSVTGIPAMDSIVLTTDWGQAEFDPVFVESVTTSPNARFMQTSDPQFGSRWQLQGR